MAPEPSYSARRRPCDLRLPPAVIPSLAGNLSGRAAPLAGNWTAVLPPPLPPCATTRTPHASGARRPFSTPTWWPPWLRWPTAVPTHIIMPPAPAGAHSSRAPRVRGWSSTRQKPAAAAALLSAGAPSSSCARSHCPSWRVFLARRRPPPCHVSRNASGRMAARRFVPRVPLPMRLARPARWTLPFNTLQGRVPLARILAWTAAQGRREPVCSAKLLHPHSVAPAAGDPMATGCYAWLLPASGHRASALVLTPARRLRPSPSASRALHAQAHSYLTLHPRTRTYVHRDTHLGTHHALPCSLLAPTTAGPQDQRQRCRARHARLSMHGCRQASTQAPA